MCVRLNQNICFIRTTNGPNSSKRASLTISSLTLEFTHLLHLFSHSRKPVSPLGNACVFKSASKLHGHICCFQIPINGSKPVNSPQAEALEILSFCKSRHLTIQTQIDAKYIRPFSTGHTTGV